LPPDGFAMGIPTAYYDITTTAAFDGYIQVCIDYSNTTFINESTLQLFHFENEQWVDVTTSHDMVNDIICGNVTSLSPFAVCEASLQVSVDIKPGSDRNPINLKNSKIIPVAILTTATFDATTVDPQSARFGPNGATIVHDKGHIQDVDSDSDLDLIFHFKTQDTGIQCGDTQVSLTGRTFDGQAIIGTDVIETVGCDFEKEATAEAPIPEEYALFQSYPNPFNLETTIRFALPQADHVVVKIYNTLGEEIRTLVEAEYDAGYHHVSWDGHNETGNPVASGVYFYKLEASAFSQLRQMILLR
jgi:hypothetical protein